MGGAPGYERPMPTYAIERCLESLSSIEVYSGQMSRSSSAPSAEPGATRRVTFMVRTDPDPKADLEALRATGERLARVAHPAVPRLRDVFLLDGRVVFVTDEIGGRSLADLLAERPVPSGAAFEIGAQVAGALEAVFTGPDRQGGPALKVRHEALTPGMVRIDRHGVVKLMGIGLGPGEAVVSPERVLAQEEGLESDVFALADLLVSATGQITLFEGIENEALHAMMVDPNAMRAHCDLRIDALRDALGTDRGVALLRAMTAPRKADRPTMAQVAARCDLISDSVEAMGLNDYARARVPAAPSADHGGRFTGRQVTTEAPSLWTVTETPPTPPPRPATPRVAPVTAPLPPAPDRPPVLGEHPTAAVAPAVVSASLTDQGPMPWSDAETLALFDETPSLAPPRELQAIIVNPARVPQLVRQHWDDGVTRRYRLAMMTEQLAEEPVDEDTPTLVVRDENGHQVVPSSSPSGNDPEPVEDAPRFAGPPGQAPDEAPSNVIRTVYDAPEVSEAGAGAPPSMPVATAANEGASGLTAVERSGADSRAAITGQTPGGATPRPLTPPAFPVPPGLESLIADPAARSEAVPPEFASSSAMPSPTVVPMTEPGHDAILGSDHGALDSLQGAPPEPQSGPDVSLVAGVVIGGLLGLVAGAAVLYLFVISGPV